MQTNFIARLIRLPGDREGATAIEYGLIAALIGIAIMTAQQGLGNELNRTFSGVESKLAAGNAAG